MDTQPEVERKFAVSEDFRLSEVGFPASVDVSAAREVKLDSIYFDTPDLRLAHHGITLRRRTGGDEGWHLKIPWGEDTRLEVREPLARAKNNPPKSLRDLVSVHVRGGDMQPVARIATTRELHRLRARDGQDNRVLADVADDRVSAEVYGDDPAKTDWREIEVELVDGAPAVLDAASNALTAAGARPPRTRSKLAYALDDRVAHSPLVSQLSKSDTAADVVMTYVHEQVAALKEADPAVRLDAPDAVHQMRVACRRLRSALKTFRPVLDRARTDPVRDELKWIAAVLGDARDTEVMHARLRHDAQGDPAGTALARIDHDLDDRYAGAHRAALQAMTSQRYSRLLGDLDDLLDDPPLMLNATEPAGQILPPLAGRAFDAMRRLHDAAEAASTPEDREAGLHEVRKAAKRARYAAEAMTLAFGKDAKRFAAAMEQVQEVLGEHHDSVVTQQTLADMAARAHAAGEDTFELGRIAGREEQRLRAADDEYRTAWKAASKKKLRRWTRGSS